MANNHGFFLERRVLMDKIKDQILKYLEAKYGVKASSYDVEMDHIRIMINQRQDDDVPKDLMKVNDLASIVSLFEQCGKENMISYSHSNNEQAKQIVESYYKLLNDLNMEDDTTTTSEVAEEKKAMIELHNKRYGTSYKYFCEVAGSLKRIVDERKFPDIYKGDTDIAGDLLRLVDDIELIESLGKSGIITHIRHTSSPIHEQTVTLMNEWVELRKKYLDMEVKGND